MNEDLKNLKVVFFGTSDFAVPIVDALYSSVDLVAIVTQPDKPVGRKKELQSTPVYNWAREHDITEKVYRIESLKESQELLAGLNADIFVVAAYGKIIPLDILELPQYKSINVHGSILPEYRGASPLHQALLDGKTETGNTIMLMDEKMDHGPILTQSKVEITPHDDFKTLENKMAQDGAQLLLETLPGYINGTIKPQPQDHEKATYVSLISKNDGEIDWSISAEDVVNMWRAYKYWPGIFTFYKDKNGEKRKLRLDEVTLSDKNSDTENPGTLHFDNKSILISCGNGSIEVLQLTPENKSSMDAASFINGHQYLDEQQLGA